MAEGVATAAAATAEDLWLVSALSDVCHVDEAGFVTSLEDSEGFVEGYLVVVTAVAEGNIGRVVEAEADVDWGIAVVVLGPAGGPPTTILRVLLKMALASVRS
jgi:hypothetical protein